MGLMGAGGAGVAARLPWLQTNPGAQWFTYFRVYGPGSTAFDDTWKPSDFHST